MNFGADTGMSVDQQDVGGVRQGLLKFGNIFGTGPANPVGLDDQLRHAHLQVFNDSNSAMQMSLYRMHDNWDQATATWNSFGSIGGVQASEGEAEGFPRMPSCSTQSLARRRTTSRRRSAIGPAAKPTSAG